MKKIKIIAGTFGWSHGKYDIVKAGDPPIEVDDALAKRLVEKGVAEYATPTPASEETQNGDISLEEMSAKELRELGEQYGLTFPVKATKAEMIAAILEETQESDDAPAFDAAEAVQ